VRGETCKKKLFKNTRVVGGRGAGGGPTTESEKTDKGKISGGCGKITLGTQQVSEGNDLSGTCREERKLERVWCDDSEEETLGETCRGSIVPLSVRGDPTCTEVTSSSSQVGDKNQGGKRAIVRKQPGGGLSRWGNRQERGRRRIRRQNASEGGRIWKK